MGPLAGVASLVLPQVFLGGKSQSAGVAGEGPLARVDPSMDAQQGGPREGLLTHRTGIGFPEICRLIQCFI